MKLSRFVNLSIYTQHMKLFNLATYTFFLNSNLRTLNYNATSRHQFIIDFEMTQKTMFRTPYPVRIKVSIFNSLVFFLMTASPPFFSSCSNFLLIPYPPMFILCITLNLGWVLEILVFLS